MLREIEWIGKEGGFAVPIHASPQSQAIRSSVSPGHELKASRQPLHSSTPPFLPISNLQHQVKAKSMSNTKPTGAELKAPTFTQHEDSNSLTAVKTEREKASPCS